MSADLGWGVVGTGGWADRYLVPAIRMAPESRLLAVFSRDAERARAFARGHQAEAGYDDFGRFLSHPGVDVVYVATPNSTHASYVVPAARAGKHVLCDITMAASEADCIAMVTACRQAGVKLGMDFQTRYHPANREAHRLLREGAIGDLLTARVQMAMQWYQNNARLMPWAGDMPPALSHPEGEHRPWVSDLAMRGGGITASGGMFAMDLIRYMVGADIDTLFCYSDVASAPRGQESTAAAALRFANGVLGFWDASRRTPYAHNSLTLYGTRGRITASGSMRPFDTRGALEVVSEQVSRRTDYSGTDNMFLDLVEAFNRTLLDGGDPSPSGVDGWRERQASIAAVESSRRGSPLRLLPQGGFAEIG